MISLSEQQLVDCAGARFGNFGCGGGLQEHAFDYTESNALETEADYPYTARKGHCVADASKGVVGAKDYTFVAPSNPAQMQAALDQQPLAVSIEADQYAFQTYTSGVLSSGCGTSLDHAVLAVGYGSENGQDFWLIKNSWNTTWGDQGYIKLARDAKNGACGVQMEPLWPSV